MVKACAPLVACAALAVPSLAEQPLMCFGNEPSWKVDLTKPGIGKAEVMGEETTTYRGGPTRNEVLKETLWRGAPDAGRDLVVFLSDKSCSDQMSDVVHPVTARVSFPDGRFFAGCCRVVGGGGGAAAAGASALQANVWRLQSLPGKDAKALAAARQPLTMRFEAGRVSGFSGCNRLVGSYTVEGDTVTPSQLAGTMMACPEPAMALESAFRAALGGPLRFSIDGDRLSLKPASGEPLVLVAEVQRLDGDWKVSGFNNGRDAVVGLSGEAPVALSFEKAPSPGTRAATRASLPGSPTAGTVRSGTCRSVLQRCHRRVTFRS